MPAAASKSSSLAVPHGVHAWGAATREAETLAETAIATGRPAGPPVTPAAHFRLRDRGQRPGPPQPPLTTKAWLAKPAASLLAKWAAAAAGPQPPVRPPPGLLHPQSACGADASTVAPPPPPVPVGLTHPPCARAAARAKAEVAKAKALAKATGATADDEASEYSYEDEDGESDTSPAAPDEERRGH